MRERYGPDKCQHCSGDNGSHMRWCTPEGPLYEGRRNEYAKSLLSQWPSLIVVELHHGEEDPTELVVSEGR